MTDNRTGRSTSNGPSRIYPRGPLELEDTFEKRMNFAEGTRVPYDFATEDVLALLGSHIRLRRALEAINTYSGLSEGEEYHTADLIPCGEGSCCLCLIEGTSKAALDGRDV